MRPTVIRAVLVTAALLAPACAAPEIPLGEDRCQTPGVDPFQLTALGPTDRSHWLQPWRAYLDTWPASRLRRAIGIGVRGDHFQPGKLPLLAARGFSRGIFAFQWAVARFDDPARLQDDSLEELRTRLLAMRAAGLRPTVLLYGHEGSPTPLRTLKLRLLEAAARDARTIKIDPAQIAQIVPHRTGLTSLTGYKAAEVLITAVDPAGQATLSRPLPVDLPAGAHDASTLRFPPWTRPTRADGTSNPMFAETLQGWLAFVRATVRATAEALGDSAFDVEIWNELVTGAMFLDSAHYYDPPIDDGRSEAAEVIPRAILEHTVRLLRDPALGLPDLGIGNGFANTAWPYAGSNEVIGVTALDRHVSVQGQSFPSGALVDESRPLDAGGRPAGTRAADGTWREAFTPRYEAYFPELPLTAIQPYKARRPGQIIRDLAPISTLDANGVAHGRHTRPSGAPAPPAVWLTAMSTRPKTTAEAPAGRIAADVWRFQAKAVLRSLAAYVSKGAEAVFFYNPQDDLALVDFADPGGGVVLSALGRFRAAFDGPERIQRPRALSLVAVRGCEGGLQFEGDGTPAHPPLSNREVVAFFPFQTDERRFVAAVYVMTRDLMRAYGPGAPATDVGRYDLPPEPYDLVIEGVAGADALIEASDPLNGTSVEVTVKSRSARRLVVSVPLTDSVRLLTITEP